MKTKVQVLREEKGLTQTGLAEKSGLSLRTIQRVEAGKTPAGFTLTALSKSLGIELEDLILPEKENKAGVDRAKLINISALSSLVLPFGNIILPSILTYKTKEPEAKQLGKSILSVQIIFTFALSILMIACPFVQQALSTRIPLFIVVLLIMKCINLYIILKNGSSLNQKAELAIKLKNNIL